MDLILRPETERLLEESLRTGQYSTAADVVHDALVALIEINAMAPDGEAIDAIDRAEDQTDAGQYRGWKEARDQVRASFLGE